MLALVDEWGNPSPTGHGTDWFGFAAILLLDNQIDDFRLLYEHIRSRLNPRNPGNFHTRNLRLNAKYHILRLIADFRPSISIVTVRIHDITSENLRRPGWAYRYYAKEIVRIASHFAVDHHENARVVFHQHGYLAEITRYINVRLRGNSFYMGKKYSRRIDYDALESLTQESDNNEPLLCLVDCLAHACHLALNPDQTWECVNPSCLNLFKECIWPGPSYDRNACLFGVPIEPAGIPTRLIPNLPDIIRVHWE